MKRYALLLIAAFLVAAPLAHAAATPLFSSNFHIVPDAHDIDPLCPVGAPLSYGAVLELIHRFMNVGVSVGIIVCTLIIMWAGILLITSSTNPEAKSTARKMLGNAGLGLLIILSSWLIVDFVMKTLYNPSAEFAKAAIGPWNSILNGGKACVIAKENAPLFSGSITAVPAGTGSGTGTNTGTGSGANCPAGDPSVMVAFPASVTQGETERATQTTVDNFIAMRTAALADGIDLKVTDGYRSDAEQVTLWNRYQQGTGGIAARPCSLGGGGSNHNSGQAIDIAVGCSNGNSSCDTAAYRWLKAHGSQWSFSNAIPSDPVHWSPSGR